MAHEGGLDPRELRPADVPLLLPASMMLPPLSVKLRTCDGHTSPLFIIEGKKRFVNRKIRRNGWKFAAACVMIQKTTNERKGKEDHDGTALLRRCAHADVHGPRGLLRAGQTRLRRRARPDMLLPRRRRTGGRHRLARRRPRDGHARTGRRGRPLLRIAAGSRCRGRRRDRLGRTV